MQISNGGGLYRPRRFRRPVPKTTIPGRALAGTVESVGTNVTGFDIGDAVYGTCDGAFAEYARVESSKLAAKPATVPFEQAATAPISGVTALQAVRKAHVQTGQSVLIVGASGGAGHVLRADRQVVRCRGHRRVQHPEDRLVRA